MQDLKTFYAVAHNPDENRHVVLTVSNVIDKTHAENRLGTQPLKVLSIETDYDTAVKKADEQAPVEKIATETPELPPLHA